MSGQPLIYEYVNGIVYARYRDPPYNQIERWIIGDDTSAVDRAQGHPFSYSEWQDMMHIAETNHTMKTQLDKIINLYYILKEEK